jgi:Na+/proline symporter
VQLAPAFFALFWKRGSKKGAVTGIILGFVVCFYTLLLPMLRNHLFFQYIYSRRTLGPLIFKTLSIFGFLDYLEPIQHGVYC